MVRLGFILLWLLRPGSADETGGACTTAGGRTWPEAAVLASEWNAADRFSRIATAAEWPARNETVAEWPAGNESPANRSAGTEPAIEWPAGTEPAADWPAGERISADEVARLGEDRCFRALPIDDALFARIEGRSFKKECTTPRASLRYLRVLHYDPEGNLRRGEMICHVGIAQDLLEIFRTLYDARYPIRRMVLVDCYDADDMRSMEANNTSAFNFRYVAGTKRLSNHSLGRAVDINPLYNPYVRRSGGRTIVEPAAAAPYVDRTRDFPCKIDTADLCYKEFTRRGFQWGGHWKTMKDYQHFEKH